MKWTLTLPADVVDYDALNLNGRKHRLEVAAAVAQVRQRVAAEARTAQLGRHDHITALLTYHPPDRGRRDRVNAARVHKAMIDGLVDARVIPDDTPEHLTDYMPHIGEPRRPAEWVLEIEAGSSAEPVARICNVNKGIRE